jgi:hypothetical protein
MPGDCTREVIEENRQAQRQRLGSHPPPNPRIAAWYKSGHGEIVCKHLVPRMCLLLLFFWCRKEDSNCLWEEPSARIDSYPLMYILVDTSEVVYE